MSHVQFSNAARLLKFYQLWLDDLFPRAKFSDGLAIIEKLGHSKRMQVMRREWIDEEKPKEYSFEFEEDARHNQIDPDENQEVGPNSTDDRAVIYTEDSESNRINGQPSDASKQQEPYPEDDELDALLNDKEPTRHVLGNTSKQQEHDAGFGDELEAMEEFGILDEIS